MRTFAPRLTDESIDIAVRLLDGWTGKLTWDRFLAILETEVGHKYSKVAMHKQPRIMVRGISLKNGSNLPLTK